MAQPTDTHTRKTPFSQPPQKYHNQWLSALSTTATTKNWYCHLIVCATYPTYPLLSLLFLWTPPWCHFRFMPRWLITTVLCSWCFLLVGRPSVWGWRWWRWWRWWCQRRVHPKISIIRHFGVGTNVQSPTKNPGDISWQFYFKISVEWKTRKF